MDSDGERNLPWKRIWIITIILSTNVCGLERKLYLCSGIGNLKMYDYEVASGKLEVF